MAFIALCLWFVLGLVIECYCFVWWFWVIVVLDILVVWCDYGYLAGVGWDLLRGGFSCCCGWVVVWFGWYWFGVYIGRWLFGIRLRVAVTWVGWFCGLLVFLGCGCDGLRCGFGLMFILVLGILWLLCFAIYGGWFSCL